MNAKRWLRGFGFATMIALGTVGIEPQTASALPRDECSDLLNQARLYSSIAQSWIAYGQALVSLGFYQQAQDAFFEAQVATDWTNAATADYKANGC